MNDVDDESGREAGMLAGSSTATVWHHSHSKTALYAAVHPTQRPALVTSQIRLTKTRLCRLLVN
jgi:hypothetical protein